MAVKTLRGLTRAIGGREKMLDFLSNYVTSRAGQWRKRPLDSIQHHLSIDPRIGTNR